MTHRLSRLACAAALTATTVGLALDASPVSATTRTVSTTDDVVDAGDPFLSLREAINESNANPTIADTIIIPAGTYTLQCPTGAENSNASGDLDILSGVTLSGPTTGTAVITINPACGERVIEVSITPIVATIIENLTISGGRETSNFGSGGGLRISGGSTMTTVRNSIIEDNEAGPNGDGGGISARSPLTIENTEFFDNHAGDADGNNAGGDGGAIAMFTVGFAAPLTITDSIIGSLDDPNTSGDGAGAGAAGSGGGVSADTESDLTVTRTTIVGNRLGVGGNGVPGDDAGGGGIATRTFTAEAGIATITESIITANQGGNGFLGGGGGAWLANLDVTITGTTISNNTVPAASQGTSAGHGGGIAITPGVVPDAVDVTLTGNTIAGNTIATPGISTASFGPGGGNGGGVYIDADSGDIELINNVFDANVAGDNNVGTTAAAAPAGSGGNVYVSLLVTGANPPPGTITIRGGAIRNGRSGGGTAGTAGWGGGAHLIAGTQTVGGTIVLDDVEITGNATKNTTAGGVGGGVYARSFNGSGTAGSITIDGVTASDNETADGRTGAGNSGGVGGAMYLEAGGTTSGTAITIRDSDFDGNSTGSGTAATSGLGGAGGDGGAVYASAEQVLVDGSTFTDNSTGNGATGTTAGGGGDGGALFTNDAAVTMTATTFNDNTTGNGGSGTATNGGASGNGGGFFARDAGAVSINGSSFTDNATGNGGTGQTSGGSSGDGGGAAIDVSVTDAAVSITSSTFTSNAVGDGAGGGSGRSGIGGDGGGASIDVDGGDVTLDAVRVIGNQAGDGADNSSASGSDARGGFGGDGGGIAIRDSQHQSAVTVTNSTFSDNLAGDAGTSTASDAGLAGDGGGIFVDAAGFSPDPVGTATFGLERSTLVGNYGGSGAAGAGATASGGNGGGAYLRVGAGVDIERSTIHGNGGGGLGTGTSAGDGGGLFIADGASTATFEHVTMTANDGLNGVNLLTRAATNSFRSTAIGEKADRDFENCNAVGVTMTSNGFNVEGSEGGFTCQFDAATDLEVESLELGPLTNSGGTTLTRLPIFDSPLINLRPCTATTDQRGVAAPSGDGCDTGAAEAEFADVVVTTNPARFADTRASGKTFDGRFEADGRQNAESQYRVEIAGRGDIPADAAGAILNITAVGPTDGGYVTVHPCLPTPPLASSLNYTARVNLGNEIIAGLDDSGAACFFTFASTHLTVDVVGYIPAASPYVPLTPSRILETRDLPNATTVDGRFEGEGRTRAGSTIRLDVADRAGVAPDAAAVVINVTAVRAEELGFITVHPCLPDLPVAASLNFTPGANRGNELIAQLNDRGQLCLFTSSEIHVTVDVVGFVPAGSAITPVLPQRLVDTRQTTKRPPNSELRVQVTTSANTAPFVPAGASAAIVNVTVVQPEDGGFVTVYPCLATLPLASSLNYVERVNGGNELVARLSESGELCLFTNQRTHFTVDIVGYLL